jgi:hypothetical protein
LEGDKYLSSPRHSTFIAQDADRFFVTGPGMTSARQGDLFTPESQSDPFDDDAPTPVFRADPDEVRAELYKILAEARGGEDAAVGAEAGLAVPDHFSANDELVARGRGGSTAL